MPRDGSNIYVTPAGTNGVPNAPIESAKYNANVADVAQDLNLPRPIVAGGTGANSAHQALINLHGEESGQLVTNYDSFTFVSGSIYSAAGATSAPTANSFAGICYTTPDPGYLTIEARDINTGKLYVRGKVTGTWGPWIEQISSVDALDARYVNVAGDTMTGSLSVNGASVGGWPFVVKALANNNLGVFNDTGGIAALGCINDAGSAWQRLNINSPTVFTTAVTTGSAATGILNFGNAGAQLNYDGSKFIFSSGAVYVHKPEGQFLITFANDTAGQVRNLRMSGTNLDLSDNSNSSTSHSFQNTGDTWSNGSNQCRVGYKCQPGANAAPPGYVFNNNWITSAMECWVDSTNVGRFTITSDYRIKKDVIDLPGMWDTVKALRPIQYTQADFSPPSHIKYTADEVARSRKEAENDPTAAPKEVNTGPLFAADDVERWGFIAHELQETLVPSASTGEKDSPDTVQSPNPWTVIAALTKALQEAMTRIEALEATR